jgi:hypothetical protein
MRYMFRWFYWKLKLEFFIHINCESWLGELNEFWVNLYSQYLGRYILFITQMQSCNCKVWLCDVNSDKMVKFYDPNSNYYSLWEFWNRIFWLLMVLELDAIAMWAPGLIGWLNVTLVTLYKWWLNVASLSCYWLYNIASVYG